VTSQTSPRLVGIAGGSASGKSELAKLMADRLRDHAVLVSQDWYYRDRSELPPAEKLKLNFDHPSAFDHALLHRHLIALKAGQAVRVPQYDYVTHARTASHAHLSPRSIILLEGLLVLHDPRIRALLDFSVFIDVPADTRLLRRLHRDVTARGLPFEETLRLYEHCVSPMHERFVQPSACHANVVWNQAKDRHFPKRLTQQLKAMLPGTPAVPNQVSSPSPAKI